MLRLKLEEDTTADLDDPRTERTERDSVADGAEGSRGAACRRRRTGAQRGGGGGEVGEVEDVGRLTTKLELHLLVNRELTEDRSSHCAAAGAVELILAEGTVI